MKRYELFLLFIFLCLCLECKYNEKNIRKLDESDNPNSYETDDYTTDIDYSDTVTDTGTQANLTETISKPRIIIQNKIPKAISKRVKYFTYCF